MKQFAILLLSILGTTIVFAQDSLPYMYSDVGITRVGTFNSNQRNEITGHQGIDPNFKTEVKLFKFKTFIDSLSLAVAKPTYIKIYLAIPENAGNLKNRIAFIVSPCDANKKDFGSFYVFDKNTPTGSGILINDDTFAQWIFNYENVKPFKKIDPKDKYNHPNQNMIEPATDTRFVTYCFKDVDTLFRLVKKHSTNGLSNNIKLTLGSLDSKGINGHQKYRTVIQISLLDSSENEIKIASLPGITKPRAQSQCPDFNKIAPLGTYDADNGQLCPYNCPTR